MTSPEDSRPEKGRGIKGWSRTQWTWREWREMCERTGAGLSQIKGKTTAAAGAILPFLHEQDLLKWTEALTKTAATAYDKAMDREYLKTRTGGAHHRLFDVGDLQKERNSGRGTRDPDFPQVAIGVDLR